MAAIDRTEAAKKYPGKWVAFANDEMTIVGVADTPWGAEEEAHKNGYPDPGISYMPKDLLPHFGGFF